MKRLGALVLAVMTLAGCASAPGTRAPIYSVQDFRYRAGDDPAWASPGYADSTWQAVALGDVDRSDGIYWLRASFELAPEHRRPGRPFAVQLLAMATAEIYWDGAPLPASGRVGATPAEEIPGPIAQTVHVPDSLAAPGHHVLALRLSSHHRGFDPETAFWAVMIGDYQRLVSFQPMYAATAMLGLGGLVIVGLFFLVLFLLQRREASSLVLGLLCLTAAALLVAESWRPMFGYTYDWHIVRLRVVTALSYTVSLLLVGSALALFPLRPWRIVLAAAALLLTIPMFVSRSWDPKQVGMLSIGMGGTLAWCGYAALRRIPGAIPATLAVAVTALIGWLQPGRFADQLLYLLLNALMAGLLVAQALRIRRTRREREAALLKSARLETELLRRHIQPHFLMNTLTALQQWIEEDPHVASRLILALADEFRALSAVADRPLVRLADELRLCESHVAVMRLRRGADIRLDARDLDPEAEVPPATFHTLVENAITHAPDGTRVAMTWRAERAGGRMRYVFEAPGDGMAPGPEGTGIRYVRARLDEAFGGDWTLAREHGAGIYRTVITVPAGDA